jgi:hypothetical protein
MMTNDEFRSALPEHIKPYFDRMVSAEPDNEPAMFHIEHRDDPNADAHWYRRVCDHLGRPWQWATCEEMAEFVFRIARQEGFEVTPDGLGAFIGDN